MPALQIHGEGVASDLGQPDYPKCGAAMSMQVVQPRVITNRRGDPFDCSAYLAGGFSAIFRIRGGMSANMKTPAGMPDGGLDFFYSATFATLMAFKPFVSSITSNSTAWPSARDL